MPLIRQVNQSDRNTVISLLKDHGKDSLSYFHLQDERQYFFSPSRKSFLSFKILNKVAIVAADPVGPASEIPLLLKSFLTYTSTWKLTPCFIGLSNTYLYLIKGIGLKAAKIGEEAILHLDMFDRSKLKKKIKRAVRHIEDLGIEIFFFNPTTMPSHIRQQVEDISSLWVKKKGGREKGFSMTLKRIPDAGDRDCQIVVAVKEENVLGYICFVPAYTTKTLSLDQARKREDAPNGLNEYLIVKSAEYFRDNHIKKLSLNFATFSNIASTEKSKITLKMLVSGILEKVYKCDSLRSFNEKFYPIWESRYMAIPTVKHAPLYLLAILRAER